MEGALQQGKETESVGVGKFLKSGKWGRCLFPTHPLWKRREEKDGHGDIFQMKYRGGKFISLFFSPSHLLSFPFLSPSPLSPFPRGSDNLKSFPTSPKI